MVEQAQGQGQSGVQKKGTTTQKSGGNAEYGQIKAVLKKVIDQYYTKADDNQKAKLNTILEVLLDVQKQNIADRTTEYGKSHTYQDLDLLLNRYYLDQNNIVTVPASQIAQIIKKETGDGVRAGNPGNIQKVFEALSLPKKTLLEESLVDTTVPKKDFSLEKHNIAAIRVRKLLKFDSKVEIVERQLQGILTVQLDQFREQYPTISIQDATDENTLIKQQALAAAVMGTSQLKIKITGLVQGGNQVTFRDVERLVIQAFKDDPNLFQRVQNSAIAFLRTLPELQEKEQTNVPELGAQIKPELDEERKKNLGPDITQNYIDLANKTDNKQIKEQYKNIKDTRQIVEENFDDLGAPNFNAYDRNNPFIAGGSSNPTTGDEIIPSGGASAQIREELNQIYKEDIDELFDKYDVNDAQREYVYSRTNEDAVIEDILDDSVRVKNKELQANIDMARAKLLALNDPSNKPVQVPGFGEGGRRPLTELPGSKRAIPEWSKFQKDKETARQAVIIKRIDEQMQILEQSKEGAGGQTREIDRKLGKLKDERQRALTAQLPDRELNVKDLISSVFKRQEDFTDYITEVVKIVSGADGVLRPGSLKDNAEVLRPFTQKVVKKKETTDFKIAAGARYKIRDCC